MCDLNFCIKKASVESISAFHAGFTFAMPIKLIFDCCFQITSLCGVSKLSISFLFIIFFVDYNIFNPAIKNSAQIINFHRTDRTDSLIFPQSVNGGAAYVVLVNKSVGALITVFQRFPKRSIFNQNYHQ